MNLGSHLRALPVQTVVVSAERPADSIESRFALPVSPSMPTRASSHEFNTPCTEAHPVSPIDDFLMSDEKLVAARGVGKETDARNEEFLGVQKRPEEGVEEKDEDFEEMMRGFDEAFMRETPRDD